MFYCQLKLLCGCCFALDVVELARGLNLGRICGRLSAGFVSGHLQGEPESLISFRPTEVSSVLFSCWHMTSTGEQKITVKVNGLRKQLVHHVLYYGSS